LWQRAAAGVLGIGVPWVRREAIGRCGGWWRGGGGPREEAGWWG